MSTEAPRHDASVSMLALAKGSVSLVPGFGAVLLTLVALAGFRPAFGGARYLMVGGIGAALGAVIVTMSRRLRLPPGTAPALCAVVFIVVGDWLVGADAWSPAVPSLDSARDMVDGGLHGWSNLVTSVVPVGGAQGLLVVPWLGGLACGALSTAIAIRRSAFAVAAAAPPMVLFVVGITSGIDRPASTWQAPEFVALLVIWCAVLQQRSRPGAIGGTYRRWTAGLALLSITAVVGSLVGSTTLVRGGEPRLVLRERKVPPVDLIKLPSPLEGFRRYRELGVANRVLFTISGLHANDRLRLATMDDYDGVVWRVQGGPESSQASGFFQRVGERIPSPRGTGEVRAVTVTVKGYKDIWLPTLGDLTRIRFQGARGTKLSEGLRYNLATGTAVYPGGLSAGDGYRAAMTVARSSTSIASGDADPTVAKTRVADIDVLDKAVEILTRAADPDASPLEQARLIERHFRGHGGDHLGYLSDGVPIDKVPSLAGHSAPRMSDFLDPRRSYYIGDEEQYASAMALMAVHLGLPARVVMGFKPKVTGPVTNVRAKDVTAWVEVAIAGHGWVVLDPTPTNRRPPPTDVQHTPPPDHLFPTPPVTTPDVAAPSGGGSGGTNRCSEGCDVPGAPIHIPTWAKAAGSVVLFPALLIGGSTGVMAGLKWRRRKRRRTSGGPSNQVAAGWMEVCDVARDLGDVVPDRATRRELAVLISRPGVSSLASRADTVLFSGIPVAHETANQYWSEVDTLREAMLGSTGLFARWRATINPTSLRRGRSQRSTR